MKYLFTTFAVLAGLLVQSQTNYALNLNGSNQYVSIGAPIATNSSYTKEAWVYSTSNAGNRNIMSSSTHPFWITGSTLVAGQSGNYTRVMDVTSFPLNRWVHVAVTYDAATTTMRLYRDGNLVSTNTSTPQYTSENEFIGSHAGTASYFQGRIDEVKVWNIALTATQLKQNAYRWPANNAAGLVRYFKCDHSSGTVLTNATGGPNGTVQNGATFIASPVQFAGNALSFDGTDDYISVADHASLDITTAITIEAWVYATKNTGIQNVISKSSNTENTGYIFPRTDDGWANAFFYLHIGGAWQVLSAAYPSLNAWHHLAATYDGATMRLYINGAEVASRVQAGTILANNNILALGNQPGYSEYFGGRVDELRIWNVARTQGQIQAKRFGELDASTQTGLVSYYNFNNGIPSGDNSGMTMAYDQSGGNNGTFNNIALSGASSNFILQNGNIIVLPLRWLSFTVQKQPNDHVLLQWSTAGEENTKDFTVQHSSNGSSWTAIGTLPAAGNSTGERKYNMVHPRPSRGINYYRILQTDIDGSGSYSEIRSLRYEPGTAVFGVQNYNGVLRITLPQPSLASFYSIEGKLVWKKQLNEGVNTIDVNNHPKGIYLLKTKSGVRKVVL